MKLLGYYQLAHTVIINISENEQRQLPKDRKPLTVPLIPTFFNLPYLFLTLAFSIPRNTSLGH